MQLDLTVHQNCGGKGSYNLHLIKRTSLSFPSFHLLSAVVRVDGGPQPDTPPPEVWGRGGSVRAEDGERRLGTWTVDGKRNWFGSGGGGTLECKTGWFICEVATEQRLDSSSLHIESDSIYQCAWTQPLWQYQPLSVPVSLEIHNHRYMPLY